MRPMGPARPHDEDRADPPRPDARASLGPADAPRLIAIAVVAIATLVVVTADWQSPIRVALTIGYLLFVPGLALAEVLEIDDPVLRLALASGASLALEALVAVVLLYAGLFSPEAACAIVVGFTCLALLLALLRRGWHTPHAGADREGFGAAT